MQVTGPTAALPIPRQSVRYGSLSTVLLTSIFACTGSASAQSNAPVSSDPYGYPSELICYAGKGANNLFARDRIYVKDQKRQQEVTEEFRRFALANGFTSDVTCAQRRTLFLDNIRFKPLDWSPKGSPAGSAVAGAPPPVRDPNAICAGYACTVNGVFGSAHRIEAGGSTRIQCTLVGNYTFETGIKRQHLYTFDLDQMDAVFARWRAEVRNSPGLDPVVTDAEKKRHLVPAACRRSVAAAPGGGRAGPIVEF